LRITPPAGWIAQKIDKSFLDPSQISEGAVTAVSLWAPVAGPTEKKHDADSKFLLVACVSAPSTEWAVGMETIVFERMTTIVKGEISKRMHLESLDASPFEEQGKFHLQSFTTLGEPGTDQHEGAVRVLATDQVDEKRSHAKGQGLHVIGFSSAAPRVFACTSVCSDLEPALSAQCSSVVQSQVVDGALADEPSSSFTSKVYLYVHTYPLASLGALLGVLLSMIGFGCVLRAMVEPKKSAGERG